MISLPSSTKTFVILFSQQSSIIIGSDDHDSEDHVKELIELVMAMTDKNNDGIITFDEFK